MSDIAELFRRDPLSLTREDTEKIVAAYRDRRKQFLLAQLNGGGKKQALTKKEAETKKSLSFKTAIEL